VRPIITSGKSRDPSRASREHKVWVEDGLVSCSGGKLTTFHHMALDVLSRAKPFLPPASEPTGEQIFSMPEASGAAILPEDPERGERLLGRYGQNAVALLAGAPEHERACIPGTQTCLAQVRWALAHESVLHLDDLMLRRTRLGILLENGGREVLESIRSLCQEVKHWDDEKWASELDRYRDVINHYYTVPAEV
jgi:glycerol-3-phosphate dehydrogenase